MSGEPGRLFEGQHQKLGFAVFNEVFRARKIGVLVGESGTGKTELIKTYIRRCAARQAIEDERRRVISFEEALQEFEREGVFSTPAMARQRAWLLERFGGRETGRASSREISHWRVAFRDHPKMPPPDLEEPQLEEDEPKIVPRPVLIVPSKTTTPTGLVRLVHQRIGRPRRPAFQFTEDALDASLEELRHKTSLFLIVDEAQRMQVETAEVLREFYDDGDAPIMLCGTPDLDALLGRPALASLRRRVAIREVIRPLSEEELREFLPDIGARFIGALHAYSEGRFGVIVNLLDAAEQVRAADGRRSLTLEDLEEGAKMVPAATPYALGRRVRQAEGVEGRGARAEREGKDGTTAAVASGEALRAKAARSAG